MNVQQAPKKKYRILFTYLLLIVAGPVIIYISSLFQNITTPKVQQGFSNFLVDNLTTQVVVAFFIIGFAIGYFLKLNPWIAGMSLFFVFPLTTLIEVTLNRGSHNLLPFELVIHFLYALPSIFAIYLGGFIKERMAKRKLKNVPGSEKY